MPIANATTVHSDIDQGTKALYSKITWRLIPFLCFCYLAAYQIGRAHV